MKRLLLGLLALVVGALSFGSVHAKEKLSESDIVYEFAYDDLGHLNPGYSAKTQVTYSEGDRDDWGYSVLKKKYPIDETYVRISSIALKKHAWGKNMTVFYIFTGAESVVIEPMDGVVEEMDLKEFDLDHKNLKVFRKTLIAKKSKKATEEVVVFKALPKSEGRLKLDVVYDELVPYTSDYSSTIEFQK